MRAKITCHIGGLFIPEYSSYIVDSVEDCKTRNEQIAYTVLKKTGKRTMNFKSIHVERIGD